MEVSIRYGNGEKTVKIPPEVRIEFLTPRLPSPIENLEEALLSACRAPIASPPLDELVRGDGKAVIVISDLTRSRGTEKLLPLCVQYLNNLDVPASSIKILMAKGTHRRLSKEEKKVLKTSLLSGVGIEEHDCDDASRLSALLLTQSGTPVRVNRALKEADVCILLAPLSFHYFAGFGGGRKLVLPGAADRAAVMANHRLSLIDSRPVALHPNCRSGILEGNPVHEDMCEVVEAIEGIFNISFFSDTSGNVVSIKAGDAIRSHEDACAEYKNLFLHAVGDPYDVAILSAGGHPNDVNFLQSHKSLRHGSGALKKGGTILWFAECPEELGSENLKSALSIPKDKFLKQAYEAYDLNNQTVVSLYELVENFEIGMVSAMNVDTLIDCGIQSCVNPESFLAEALEKHGAERLAVIPHGSCTLPFQVIGGDL
jgi:nickel-dependent lactate racemase